MYNGRMTVSVAILAGGRSTRMGFNKALADLGGRPVIESIIAQLRPLADEVFIVSDQAKLYAPFGVPCRPDVWPGLGALGGLYAALHYATSPHVLCTACDMPFLAPALMPFLLSLRHTAEVVMPRLHGEAEPLRAVYHRDCLAPVGAALQAGQRRLVAFLPQVRVRWVETAELLARDPDLRSFINLNTPADLDTARKLLPL